LAGYSRSVEEYLKVGKSMPNDELYEQLNAELESIYGTIRTLRVNQHVFWEVQQIIGRNPAIHKPSTFYDWMGKMYIQAMTAAVRRLVDRRAGTVSFIRLLDKVKRNPSCFSRSAYKVRCGKAHLPDGYLDNDYDKLVGKGREEPDSATIDAEIAALKKQTAILKRFVDEHVAHSAVNPSPDLPTFQDMDDAIDHLCRLVRRYLHLFRGVWISDILPTWTFDWKEIFRYPWIPESSTYSINAVDSHSPPEPPQSS